MTGFYVGLVLTWKRLNTYLYYLVFINIIPFNRRFLMFLLWTGLESNQVLTDAFKNVKMKKYYLNMNFRQQTGKVCQLPYNDSYD